MKRSPSGDNAETLGRIDQLLVNLRETIKLLPNSDETSIGISELDSRRAKVAQNLLAIRRKRDEIFGEELFADPFWEALLALYVARAKGHSMSVASLCAATRSPSSSALRYIKEMHAKGLISRDIDSSDNRRVSVTLTEKSLRMMQDILDNSDGIVGSGIIN